MSTFLQNDSKYTIRKIKTTLFDYDPVEMNKNLLNVADNDRAFQFRGYSSNLDVTGTSGINDSTSTVSKQGIVQKKLSSSGTPMFNYVTGKNGATATGELLFDLTKPVNGRIDYRDAELEMIYDQSTGYYEYKSAANHAQYNHSNNTIELYADTLSIYNSYIATLSLGSAFGFNGYSTSSTNANGVFKGTTVSTSPNGNQRFDPYVSFVVPNEGTTADKIGRGVDNIGQIYIKAKVPAIGKNKCQVFFNSGSGYNETESMDVEYTANGDVVEFVLDTSTCAAWTNDTTLDMSNYSYQLFDSKTGLTTAEKTDANGRFTLTATQTAVFDINENYNLTVTENTDWSWRYEPTTSSTTVTVTEDEEPALAEFKNDRTNEYYLSGDCYCENVWEESPNAA